MPLVLCMFDFAYTNTSESLRRSFYFLECKLPLFSRPSNHQHKGKRHNLRKNLLHNSNTHDEKQFHIKNIKKSHASNKNICIYLRLGRPALVTVWECLSLFCFWVMHLTFWNLAMFIVKVSTQHTTITIRRSTMLVSFTVVRFNLSWQSGFTGPAMANTRISDSGTSVQCSMTLWVEPQSETYVNILRHCLLCPNLRAVQPKH